MMDLQKQLDLLYKRVAALEAALSRGSPSPPSGSRSIMDIKDIMEAKQRVATELKNRHCAEVAMGNQWDNPENKAR